MRLTTRALLFLALVLVASLLAPACIAAPAIDQMQQWEPAASYPGGAQYDSRLDAPVQFWRPGLSLEEVFAGILRQTGAPLRFFPESDENRRVRVTLFLSEGKPPALREVMAQLQWVVDCPFFLAEEGGETVYYLMSTSMGKGAAEELRVREVQTRRRLAQREQALRAEVSELEEALELPREEAIKRYQGMDDRMLLDLLDPRQRAASIIVIRRVAPWLKTLQFLRDDPNSSYGYGYGLRGLTEEVQAAYIEAFGMSGDEFGDPDVLGIAGLSNDGVVDLHCPLRRNVGPDKKLAPAGDYVADDYNVLDIRPDATLGPEEQLALRRALGEEIDPAEAEAFLAQQHAVLTAAQQVAHQKAVGATLSPHLRDLLARTSPELPAAETYPAWRIQEAVARATGMHVISDSLLYASAPAGATALASLEAFTSQRGVDFMRSPEWEWGDAGSFLRFRTSNRDIWRASLLPYETLDWVDQQLRPLLPPAQEQAQAAGFTLDIGPEEWTRQLAGLNDLQIRYGARVVQGDPLTLAEAARHVTWRAVSQYHQAGLSLIRLLGGLAPRQWQRARDGSLYWPEDFHPDQAGTLRAALTEKDMNPLAPGSYARIRISLGEGKPFQYRDGTVELIDTHHLAPDGQGAMGGGSSDTLVGPTPEACYQATLTASAIDRATGRETKVFTKRVLFLPKTLTLHAEVPGQAGLHP